MSPMPADAITELTSPPLLASPLVAVEGMAHERCDRCGHRAYVMTATVDGPLAWCAHHYAQHLSALAGRAPVVHDIRDQLAPTNRTMH